MAYLFKIEEIFFSFISNCCWALLFLLTHCIFLAVSKKDEASSGLADKQLTLNKPIFRVIFVHLEHTEIFS